LDGQIREMQAGGICFGAHTQTHPRLIDISLDAAYGWTLGTDSALDLR
jgi:peptidoglycan/xylan/chitin deacetylase (PgdA/CDA1 family)